MIHYLLQYRANTTLLLGFLEKGEEVRLTDNNEDEAVPTPACRNAAGGRLVGFFI
jgi:hypothetical protein